ncbi:MAG: hypothetical protein AAGC76_13325 [Luteibacter sp.]|uniref:hypothetical protein n=1 Tax=Luteibacter sp. TaxID=1886636 RepID=UPI002807AB3E|nr:hypothetical protein [Luteibacter sp.]MDQ7996813.1 hypothetical protein [Luteibacter sp.]
MLRVALALAAMMGVITAADAATVLPTTYEAGHFVATPTLADGTKLRLLVDTGGGGVSYWLLKDVTTRLGLKPISCPSAPAAALVTPPVYAPGHGLPRPTGYCGGVGAIAPEEGGLGYDGIIGSSFFPEYVWTFDYPAETLTIQGADWKPARDAHPLVMGLPARRKGAVYQAFPRVTIGVPGETVDLLLDTGATAHPTKKGLAEMHTPVVNGEGVTSYVDHLVFEAWHDSHPDWPVVAGADDLFGPKQTTRAIRVPEITIGSFIVGPIWFTERPDSAFTWMSDMMDRPVHGALGGNALSPFRMTLDYGNRTAWLECIGRCKASPPAVY